MRAVGGAVSPATLVFEPSGPNAWNVAHTVTVTGVNDFVAERMVEENRASLLYVPKDRVEIEEILVAAAGAS